MIKWVIDWTQAKSYQDVIRKEYGIIWAIKMPKTYPECRVTRQGIAHIAITDDESMVEELRQDGGEVQLLP
jgi:hypothetical protein